eukprot:7196239-Pyramimonas_sp.AAC.1
MTWGSMRFVDALHVRPDSIEDVGNAVRFVAWQTKVERKRRGAKFAVCKATLTEVDWVTEGLELYKAMLPTGALLSDFSLVDGTVDEMQFDVPLTSK